MLKVDSRIIELHTEVLENIFYAKEDDYELILKFRNILKHNSDVSTVQEYADVVLDLTYDCSRKLYDMTRDTIRRYLDLYAKDNE